VPEGVPVVVGDGVEEGVPVGVKLGVDEEVAEGAPAVRVGVTVVLGETIDPGDEVTDQDDVDVVEGELPIDSEAVGVGLGVVEGEAPVVSEAVGVALGVGVGDEVGVTKGVTAD